MRVPVLVLALLAMPIAAGVAQGRGKQQRVRSTSLESDCKQEHADALARAVAEGHAPYGLDKKCSDPVPPPVNQAPVASFTLSCSGLACSFTSTSSDPDGAVASYSWTFGDGASSTLPNPPHAYGAGGSYLVTLVVTDDAGASSSSTSQTATVSAQPPPDLPPTGPHQVRGVVFEDLPDLNGEYDGVQNAFAGEMGLAGWTISLSWNGQVVATTTSDGDGNYIFSGLGNTGSGAFEVCIQLQSGYTQTAPVGGTGCGGAGYSAPFNNSSMTWFRADFAERL